MKMDIKGMTLDELCELKIKIETEIESRGTKEEEVKEFKFEFEETNDKRKNVPYVARVELGEDGKLSRQFYEMNRSFGGNQVTVYGTYTAQVGDIIEERHHGSWKNDYRYQYVITDSGEKVQVADLQKSREQLRVVKYLKKEIGIDDLIKE